MLNLKGIIIMSSMSSSLTARTVYELLQHVDMF